MSAPNNETAIIRAFHNGEPAAEEYIFKQFFKPMCLFADRLTSDTHASQDIVTEAFIKLFNKRNEFDKPGNIKAFLYVAVKNACINYNSSVKKQQTAYRYASQLNENHELTDTVFQNEILLAELTHDIYKEIENLPGKCREIFTMIFFEGKSTDQIGQELGISPQTVRTQKARAIQLIKTELLKNEKYLSFALFVFYLERVLFSLVDVALFP